MTKIFLSILLSNTLYSCSTFETKDLNNHNLNGVWQACDEYGRYSELFFQANYVKAYLPKKQTISEELQFETIGDTVIVPIFEIQKTTVLIKNSNTLVFTFPNGDKVEYKRVNESVKNWSKNDKLLKEAIKRERKFDCNFNAEGLIHFEF